MSIEEAAAATGVTKSSWANWEAGRRPHQLVEVCEAISVALDVEFNWLLLGGPLASSQGVAVTKRVRPSKAAQAEQARLTYPSQAERAMSGRPKGRGDQTRPPSICPTIRRPVRVDGVRASGRADGTALVVDLA